MTFFPNHQILLTKQVFFHESLSPLRNRLQNIAPLPSRPSTDNFARPLTRIIDDKTNTTNTIEITPKNQLQILTKQIYQGSYKKFFQMSMKK